MRILIHHESSGYTCRTTPEEDKLIVVVPLVLNLHLELDRKMSIDSLSRERWPCGAMPSKGTLLELLQGPTH